MARALHRLAAALVLAAPATALAHHAGTTPERPLEALLLVLLAASGILYALGVRRLWRRAGTGRGVTIAEAARFAAGWIALSAALLPPIDTWSDTLFSVHMIQHELLMVVAAPLLIGGRAAEAWSWAWPSAALALRTAGAGLRLRGFGAWIVRTGPAWTIHAAVLWVWHAPFAFDAALENPRLHVVQHVSFLAAALIFWWSVLRPGRTHRGAAVASLFTTGLHTAALGALLTLSATPWYAPYVHVAGAGLTPLEDQQLGGLVMWGPGGVSFLVAGLVLVARWFAERSPRRLLIPTQPHT